jgi:hypothetical protein
MRALPVALALAVASLGTGHALTVGAHPAPEAPPRYTIQSETPAPAISACGRFAVEVSASYVPEGRSPDGRYALKAVNVPSGGCEPFPDPLFLDGFEAP